jgi:hypothetical protein
MVANVEAIVNARAVTINLRTNHKFFKLKCLPISDIQVILKEYLL